MPLARVRVDTEFLGSMLFLSSMAKVVDSKGYIELTIDVPKYEWPEDVPDEGQLPLLEPTYTTKETTVEFRKGWQPSEQ